MVRFLCHECGQMHDEYPELGFSSPDYYLGLSQQQRSSQAELTDDVCRIKDDYFVRGSLEIPIVGTDDDYAFGIWVSVSSANFERYKAHLEDNLVNVNDRYVGYVSNALPDFEGTLNLHAALHVRQQWRPMIQLEPTDHPLAILQQNGMTPRQLSEIVANYIH